MESTPIIMKPLYLVFATCLYWYPKKATHREEKETHLRRLAANHLPAGSGFDCGSFIDLGKSTATKLVFQTSFHHMDQHGGYTGWTSHIVTVTPSFVNAFTLQVGGKNENNIKEYIYEVFYNALLQLVSVGVSIIPSSEEGENVNA